MNKIEFSKLEKKEDMILAFNQLKEDYSLLFSENQELKKQLEYLHCGEYLNQLRFERNMLQDVVDKMEVSKEDKRFIDMTHRNTELLEENRKLEEQLEVGEQQYNDLVEEKEELQEQLSNSHQIKTKQKEFIEWLENKLEKRNNDIKLLGQDVYTSKFAYQEILSKYKEIIGGNNDQ